MEVRKSLKTKQGDVTFEGVLSAEEHDYVLGIGLNTLLEAGALPFKQFDEDSLIDLNIQSNEQQ